MSEEAQKLLDKAERYLPSAEILQQAGDYDSAASRLYYALFHAARAMLRDQIAGVKTHQGLFIRFGELLVKPVPREMQRSLQQAFERRQLADYVADTGPETEQIEDLKQKARAFLDFPRGFLTS